MSLKEIVHLLKEKWLFVLSLTILGLAVAGLIQGNTTPKYEAKVDLFVNFQSEESESIRTNNIDMSLKLIETYKYMLKSDSLLDEVSKELNGVYSKKQLDEAITIISENESQVITIIARMKNSEQSVELANLYAATFQEEMTKLMNIETITVLGLASEDRGVRELTLPPYILYLVGALIGFLTAFFITIVREFYSSILNTTDKVEKQLKVENLGVVPYVERRMQKKFNMVDGHGFIISLETAHKSLLEKFRQIRTKLVYQIEHKNMKSILITSSVKGDGRSTVSANLSKMLALDGKKTLYIDCDFRSPSGNYLFDLPKQNGLTSVLEGNFTEEEVIQQTTTEHLFFLGAGPMPLHPPEILSSSRIREVIHRLQTQFDVIVIDAPSLEVSDAASLRSIVDGCLFIIDSKRSHLEVADEHLTFLKDLGIPVIGTVLNKYKVASI